MSFLSRWWKRLNTVSDTQSNVADSPLKNRSSEPSGAQQALPRRFDNGVGSDGTGRCQSDRLSDRSVQAPLRQDFGNVTGISPVNESSPLPDEATSSVAKPQALLRQRFDTVVRNGVGVPVANAAKVHVLLYLRWLREHEWPTGVSEIVGEREVELSYIEFCADVFLEPVPWGAVERHFNNITQIPGGPLTPCRLVPDPSGVPTRVRIYIVPLSPTKAELALEAEVDFELWEAALCTWSITPGAHR